MRWQLQDPNLQARRYHLALRVCVFRRHDTYTSEPTILLDKSEEDKKAALEELKAAAGKRKGGRNKGTVVDPYQG